MALAKFLFEVPYAIHRGFQPVTGQIAAPFNQWITGTRTRVTTGPGWRPR